MTSAGPVHVNAKEFNLLSNALLRLDGDDPGIVVDGAKARRNGSVNARMNDVSESIGLKVKWPSSHEPGSAGIPGGELHVCVLPVRTPALPETDGFMVPMHARSERGLSMNLDWSSAFRRLGRHEPDESGTPSRNGSRFPTRTLTLSRRAGVRERVRVRVRQDRGSWCESMRKNEWGFP